MNEAGADHKPLSRRLRFALAVLALGTAVGLGFRLWAVFESRGCPPALLRVFLKQDRLAGHPAKVREVERDFCGASTTTTVSTYTRGGNVLREVVQDSHLIGSQTTTYSYNRLGWLTGSRNVMGDSDVREQNAYLYLQSKRRIEIENRWEAPPGAGGSPAPAGPSGWLARLKERLHPSNSPQPVFRQTIQLDSHNRCASFDTPFRNCSSGMAFDYDASGHIRRETEVGWCIHIYKRDARGNVVEERTLDLKGKLILIKRSAYKYDAIGNWIERWNTVFWPAKTGRKPTLSSVTTRTIESWP